MTVRFKRGYAENFKREQLDYIDTENPDPLMLVHILFQENWPEGTEVLRSAICKYLLELPQEIEFEDWRGYQTTIGDDYHRRVVWHMKVNRLSLDDACYAAAKEYKLPRDSALEIFQYQNQSPLIKSQKWDVFENDIGVLMGEELKRPMILMVFAAGLLAGLIVLGGFVFSSNGRSSSQYFHCFEKLVDGGRSEKSAASFCSRNSSK